jgi:hypothetical protein
LKQTFALAAALAVGLTMAEAALAQTVTTVPPANPGPGVPSYEIVAIVRSTGLEPLHRPMRQGPSYVLRAMNPVGQEVRVIVDARSGRIVKVVPLPGPRYVAPLGPTPYGRPPGRTAMVPDGYGPSSRVTALPPGIDGPPAVGAGRPPAAAAAPHPAAPAGAPPLPRPRPKVAGTEAPAAATAPAAPPSPPKGEVKDGKETTGALTAKPPSLAPAPEDQIE